MPTVTSRQRNGFFQKCLHTHNNAMDSLYMLWESLCTMPHFLSPCTQLTTLMYKRENVHISTFLLCVVRALIGGEILLISHLSRIHRPQERAAPASVRPAIPARMDRSARRTAQVHMPIPLLRKQNKPLLAGCLVVLSIRIPCPQQCASRQDLLSTRCLDRQPVSDTLDDA